MRSETSYEEAGTRVWVEMSIFEITDMLPGYEVTREDAHLILCAFNELRGTSFTVDDIMVCLKGEAKVL